MVISSLYSGSLTEFDLRLISHEPGADTTEYYGAPSSSLLFVLVDVHLQNTNGYIRFMAFL